MTSAVTHPLASAYLRDLELLLHGVEPGERAEVLAGVHEHLDDSLAPGASDEDVRAVLAELGSAHAVADEAYVGRPAPASAAPSIAYPRPGLLSRSWLPVVVGLMLGLALLFVVLISVAGTMYSSSSFESTDSAGNVFQGPVEIQYEGAFPGSALISLLMTAAVWFPSLFLCLVSPLWDARQRVTAVLTLPLAAIAVTALPDLGWALTKSELGINIGGWTGLATALVVGGIVLQRLSQAGLRRSSALEQGAML